MSNKHVFPDAVYELDHEYCHGDNISEPVILWNIVPRICGNCPEAFESTKCKRTSCRVKSMARRGIPVVY